MSVPCISINWDFHDPGPFETANTSHTEDVVDDIISYNSDINVLITQSISIQIQCLRTLTSVPRWQHHVSLLMFSRCAKRGLVPKVSEMSTLILVECHMVRRYT